MVQELPPVFEPTNQVDLVSIENSKIVRANLYSGRAEITRLYKFTVNTGHNLVNIIGLPEALDRESLRVEGIGAATIHDVTLSNVPEKRDPELDQRLQELLHEKRVLEGRLQRTRKSLVALETYLGSFSVKDTESSKLGSILQNYDAGETLNLKVLELEESIERIDIEIIRRQMPDLQMQREGRLRLKASIGVFAASEGEVAIALIYAVKGPNWTASYDIRVDMGAKEEPVRLVYKAAITQNTGESWEDVEINLETASPIFGVALPALPVQKLTTRDPNQPSVRYPKLQARMTSVEETARRNPFVGRGGSSDTTDAITACLFDATPSNVIGHREVDVTSRGNINATFRIPGLSTLPSDGSSHNVTIAQMDLDAAMSWVAIPKVDTKTHLQAKITNASEYTFLPGIASIYVDGSFVARTQIPLVSPQESFNCPLGLDPSIRITYHPQNKKVSQSGFMSKTSQHSITQRITIFNSKTTSVNNVKIIDQLPISEIPNAIPKLLSPPLAGPEPDQPRKIPVPVKVSDGVIARWEGAEEPGLDVGALGAEGKLYWMCAIPARGTVNLALQWEIATPADTPIYGI